MDATCKPHAICVPFPLSTHINSMLKFAKLLHHNGFHVTFVNAEFQHKSILSAKGPNALDGLPDFRFESIAIDVPSSKPGSPDYFVSVREAIRKGFLSQFRSLVTKLNETERPVTCLVSDGASTHTVTLAEELGIPAVLFWAVGANGVLSINRHQELVRRCFAPKDESKANDDLDATTDFFAGRKGIRMRDVPSIIQTKYSQEYILDVTVKEAERTSKASAIVIHTFEALEKHAMDELASTFRRVYSIGPLPLLLNQVTDRSSKNLVGGNIWQEEETCVQWLNSKKPNSVIYVSFGSTAVTTPEQITEFAWGLANSNVPFLWIIRTDVMAGELSSILPPEFIEETKERGLIASWCVQEQVLNHPATGGFLTHCGWNSVLESICAGVPMICWPYFAEQMTNCRDVCNEWGLGIEIDKDVKRSQVEEAIVELLQGDRGKKIQEKAGYWKKVAQEATEPHGLSSNNLDSLVNEVLLSKP